MGIFANGKYGAGWNGVVRPEFVEKYGRDGVRGILFGDASQLGMQLINAAVVAVFGFVDGLRLVQVQQLDHPAPRESRRPSGKVWTFPKWVPWAIPTSP